ncbi:MAG: LAGLIDADG family homing endonuclease [Candidatus Aenigmatarchaeota archaeon]|nr:hypothetical protein [Candidatus Aenigmarchaeota archaeon]
MDDISGYLCGILAAKGVINDRNKDYYISIESSDQVISNLIARALILSNIEFTTLKRRRKLKDKEYLTDLFIARGKDVVNKVKSYEIKTGRHEWNVPSRAFDSRLFRISFLQAFYDIHGNIIYRLKNRQKIRAIKIISVNSNGIQQLAKLLLLEGIKPNIYSNGKSTVLEINGKNKVSQFTKKIGFTNQRKKELVENIIDPVKFDKLISQKRSRDF